MSGILLFLNQVLRMFSCLSGIGPTTRSYSSSAPRPAARANPTTQHKQQSSRDILGLNRHLLPAQDNTVEAEVDRYLSDPVMETSPLQFWQVWYFSIQYLILWVITSNSIQDAKHRYPKIFPVAMDVIPIQASSVPCERVFSSGKETMAPRRCRIKPALMEKLQMLKYGIRNQAQLNFTEGMSWATELRELEELHKDATPSDMFSYIKSLSVEDEEDEEGEEDVEDVDVDVVADDDDENDV